MTAKRLLAAALALGLAAAACDRSPTDPAAQDVEALAHAVGASATPDGPAYLLPVLLRQAIDRVAREQGRDAARQRLEPLHLLRIEARRARLEGDVETARARALAAHEAAVRLVLEVLGDGVARSAVDGLGAALDTLRQRITQAEAAGQDVTRARALGDSTAALHARAATALQAGDPAGALTLATRGGRVLAVLHHRARHRHGDRQAGGAGRRG